MVDLRQCWTTAIVEYPPLVFILLYTEEDPCAQVLSSVHTRKHIHSTSTLQSLFILSAGGRYTLISMKKIIPVPERKVRPNSQLDSS